MDRSQILILLSSKSAGSSALQSYLSHNFDVKSIRHTEHFENETLYWTKAASVLGLDQKPMHRSVVPYSKEHATKSLQKFLRQNGIEAKLKDPVKEELFDAFYRLAVATGDVIVEKSPHHLANESAIQLIIEFRDYIRDRADVHLIGLIRNPLDTVFSAWDRWRYNCTEFEREWARSYTNLRNLSAQQHLKLFQYEDLVRSTGILDRYLIDHCRLDKRSDKFTLKANSIAKWTNVEAFRHQLSDEATKLARDFGYENGRLINLHRPSAAWRLSENVNELRYKARKILKELQKLVGRVDLV